MLTADVDVGSDHGGQIASVPLNPACCMTSDTVVRVSQSQSDQTGFKNDVILLAPQRRLGYQDACEVLEYKQFRYYWR